MHKSCNYIEDHKESGFVKSCDVLLKLDDGSELPAHSHNLARASSVCNAVLDDSLSGPDVEPTLERITMPLKNCSRATVISLISAVYSKKPIEYIPKELEPNMAIATLAHKLNMQVYHHAMCRSGCPKHTMMNRRH